MELLTLTAIGLIVLQLIGLVKEEQTVASRVKVIHRDHVIRRKY